MQICYIFFSGGSLLPGHTVVSYLSTVELVLEGNAGHVAHEKINSIGDCTRMNQML